jgi:hypothetical protein
MFTSVLYLGMLLKLGANGTLTTQHYNKIDYLDCSIVNFPCLCSYIPSSPAYVYGVYTLQFDTRSVFDSRQFNYNFVYRDLSASVVTTIYVANATFLIADDNAYVTWSANHTAQRRGFDFSINVLSRWTKSYFKRKLLFCCYGDTCDS